MAQRCAGRYKRVPSKFGGTVRRCAGYKGRSSNGRRKKGGYRGKRRRSGMAFKGSHCTKGYRRVPSIYGGTVRRCKGYGRGRRKLRKGRGRGHAPMNKGKKCKPSHLVPVWSARHGRYVTRCVGKGAYGGKKNGNGARRNGNGGRASGPPGIHYAGNGNGGRGTSMMSPMSRIYGSGARGYAQRVQSFFGS